MISKEESDIGEESPKPCRRSLQKIVEELATGSAKASNNFQNFRAPDPLDIGFIKSKANSLKGDFQDLQFMSKMSSVDNMLLHGIKINDIKVCKETAVANRCQKSPSRKKGSYSIRNSCRAYEEESDLCSGWARKVTFDVSVSSHFPVDVSFY
eukprot:GHVP01008098.1.p1 GENE.GHVP01008098.1~~GHVP01008098.1.p1  ORF type:complete len:153 (+),score=29.92 GHVP01008098.1:937-1395(+)